MGSASITHVVGPEHTAVAVGSGDVEVLATPVLAGVVRGGDLRRVVA